MAVEYTIVYYSEAVQTDILSLPDTLAARYIVLTRRMVALGPNLGEPHTKAFGQGLFELRLKGAEGLARVFFLHACRQANRHAAQFHQEDEQDAGA
jgi:phage-related protein